MSASARFGQSLREARERRGLDIEQLSKETTIPVHHIEALETGLLGSLPRAMYGRAEARAYAEAVGLDPDVVLTELRRAGEGHHKELDAPVAPSATASRPISPPPPRPPTENGDAGPRLFRAIVLLVVGCAALWFERDTAPASDMPVTTAVTLPALDAANLIDEAVRIAEPPAVPTGMRRVLFDPRSGPDAINGPGAARLDGGVLVVRSTPEGARVTVNGVGWGETPVAIRYLPMGTMRVRVAKADYGVRERVVQLTPQQPRTTLRFTLPQTRRRAAASARPRGDVLVITSVPAGARVTVNGIGWGTTPLSIKHLPAGAQRIRLVKEQFETEERVVQASEEQPGRLAVTLKPRS